MLVDQDVVQPVVAVDQRGRRGVGQPGGEQVVEPVDVGQLTASGGGQLGGPAAQLPLQVPLRAAEVGEPDRGRVEPVQGGEGVDQLLTERVDTLRAERGQRRHVPVGGAGHVLHQVPGSAEHLRAGVQQQGAGDGHARAAQGGHHAVLTAHVVGGGEHVPERGPAQHPAGGAVGEHVGEVGAATLDQLRPQGAVHRAGQFPLQVGAEPGEVQPGRVGGGVGHGLTLLVESLVETCD